MQTRGCFQKPVPQNYLKLLWCAKAKSENRSRARREKLLCVLVACATCCRRLYFETRQNGRHPAHCAPFISRRLLLKKQHATPPQLWFSCRSPATKECWLPRSTSSYDINSSGEISVFSGASCWPSTGACWGQMAPGVRSTFGVPMFGPTVLSTRDIVGTFRRHLTSARSCRWNRALFPPCHTRYAPGQWPWVKCSICLRATSCLCLRRSGQQLQQTMIGGENDAGNIQTNVCLHQIGLFNAVYW